MVDTYLRPRPEFATLLASDASAGGDDLSIHQQKRALRQGKVLILQQKRQSQLLEKARALQEYRSKFTSFAAEPGKSVGGHGNRSRYWTEPGYVPRPSTVRPVKSAGMQRHVTWDSLQLARPKTADSAGSRVELLAPRQGWAEVEAPTLPSVAATASPTHQRTLSEGSVVRLEDICRAPSRAANPKEDCTELPQEASLPPDSLESLAHMYTYSTTTQRGYDEIGWSNKLPCPLPPPVSTLETKPDPIATRLNVKRLEDGPLVWQSVGIMWDILQTRTGHYNHPQGPATTFCSPCRGTLQIPGYMGCPPTPTASWDDPGAGHAPQALVRTRLPKPTCTSRCTNIPGYHGHTHWTQVNPTHSTLDATNLPTTPRVHRPIPAGAQASPFVRSSPLSRMITLSAPHNPFKLD